MINKHLSLTFVLFSSLMLSACGPTASMTDTNHKQKDEGSESIDPPQNPSENGNSDTTDSAETPDDTNKPDASEKPNDNTKPDIPETPNDTDNPDNNINPETANETNNSDSTDNTEKPDNKEEVNIGTPQLSDLESELILKNDTASLSVSWVKKNGDNAQFWRILLNQEISLPFFAITQTSGLVQSGQYDIELLASGEYKLQIQLCPSAIESSDCSTSAPQIFNVKDDPAKFESLSGHPLISAWNEQLCLTTTGGTIALENCTESLTQSWIIENQNIISAADTRMCIQANTLDFSASLQLATCDSRAEQKWNYENNILINQDWAMDINISNQQVILWQSHGGVNQQWLSSLDDATTDSDDNGNQSDKPHQAKTLSGRTDGKGFDLVFLGDGFTQQELPKFEKAVEDFIKAHQEYDPLFQHHQEVWNIHLVLIASNQSGVDEPKKGSFIDTVFGSSFECSWVDRVICVDQSKVLDVVTDYFPQFDQVMVIANSDRHGGASLGNKIITSSMVGSINFTILHELGHGFAKLGDEYTYGGSSAPKSEPRNANLTINNNFDSVKWKHWLGVGTGDSKVGLFEGGQYVNAGVWRPTNNSVMRNLGRPFHAVNLEAWTLELYRYSGTYLALFPELGQVIQTQSSQEFNIELSLGEQVQSIEWYINGQLADPGDDMTNLTVLNPDSNYQVEAHIKDISSVIRKDIEKLSSSTLKWQVSVN